MDSPALGSAALAIAGALIYYLIRARQFRPKDKYEETLRELSGPQDGYEPIEPTSGIEEEFDRSVDQLEKGFNLYHRIMGILLVGAVIWIAFTDSLTRNILFIVAAILVLIWIAGRIFAKHDNHA